MPKPAEAPVKEKTDGLVPPEAGGSVDSPDNPDNSAGDPAGDPVGSHEHVMVDDFEFLPSCNCRVAVKKCSICYMTL